MPIVMCWTHTVCAAILCLLHGLQLSEAFAGLTCTAQSKANLSLHLLAQGSETVSISVKNLGSCAACAD